MKPWYQVAVPREDLRKRQPLDASQFAVHLNQVVSGDAPPEYLEAEKFFERTLITKGLRRFSAEVIRRLAGERQAANAVLNLTTQFGGGKTHGLTLLYHLARLGPEARKMRGVADLLKEAAVDDMPKAAVATFVGTDWDVVQGSGGPGEPQRKTPWGDLAWQLSKETGDSAVFEALREQDEARTRPGKETIRKMLPQDAPVLILMDEVMNFMTGARAISVGESTLASQFYGFLQNLTEEADGRDNFVVVVSLPASELEMSAEDQQDFSRLGKITTRVADPYQLANDLEIPEIVRLRLFEDLGDPTEIQKASKDFARWIKDHRDLLPTWFPVDSAQDVIESTYPFHPVVLSVFERKWQALPSFQRTRGTLRMLAQWVSDAYEEGFKGAHADPLITLGTAPLDDQFFRSATLDQLGDDRLSAAIISDVAGDEANAEHLDESAPEALRKARVHRKAATAVFFESSGGAIRDGATLPEIRLAVGEPDLDIGNIETALGSLIESCYFLVSDKNAYKFTTKPNLNKLLADRRAGLAQPDVEERARAAVRRVFGSKTGVEFSLDPVFFPDQSSQVENVPALKLVVLDPHQPRGAAASAFIEDCFKNYGQTPRSYKNALVFSVPDDPGRLIDAARKVLAWESLEDEADAREFDEVQRGQLREFRDRALKELDEGVWRTYRFLAFMGSDGAIHEEDMGLVHSSAAESMQVLIQARLVQRDELSGTLAPSRVAQSWPNQQTEWTTKALRDAVYASPAFTRLLRQDALRATISDGVTKGLFGYAAKKENEYVGIHFKEALDASIVEFSEDVVLVQETLATQLKEAQPTVETPVPAGDPEEGKTTVGPMPGTQVPIFTGEKLVAIKWSGDIPPQKWTTFYTKVVSKFVNEGGVTLHVELEARPPGGIYKERLQETQQSLSELGLTGPLEGESSQEEPSPGGT